MFRAEVVLPGPTDVVSAEQRAVLARLAPLLPRGAYLAGGVAIAARFGHRTSQDLDLFVEGTLDAAALADAVSILGRTATVTSVADRTLYLVVDGVPVSILGYRHALIHTAQAVESLSVPLASVDDLIAMKLSAIGNRGAAKDFWDVDVMLEAGACGGTLEGAFAAFRAKYPGLDPGYVARGLSYFGDADAEPLPVGLDDVTWAQIKDRFRERSREVVLP